MTVEIRLGVAPWEHMTKQPPGKRYSLVCEAVFAGEEVDCVSNVRSGYLGEYADYLGAKDDAISHPHRAFIQFYPDPDHPEPSQEFIDDFYIQANRERLVDKVAEQNYMASIKPDLLTVTRIANLFKKD